MVSIMEIGFIRIELIHLHGLQSPRVAAQLVLIFLLGDIKVWCWFLPWFDTGYLLGSLDFIAFRSDIHFLLWFALQNFSPIFLSLCLYILAFWWASLCLYQCPLMPSHHSIFCTLSTFPHILLVSFHHHCVLLYWCVSLLPSLCLSVCIPFLTSSFPPSLCPSASSSLRPFVP